jgi:hypothetical protein
MQECFNSRRFDEADGLHAPGFFSHPLGTTGFEAGKAAWHALAIRFPGMRVVAQDILIDGDKAAVRSAVEGIATVDGDVQPMLFEIFRIDDGRFAESWGPAPDSRPQPAPRSCSAKPFHPLGGGRRGVNFAGTGCGGPGSAAAWWPGAWIGLQGRCFSGHGGCGLPVTPSLSGIRARS